MGWNNPPIPWSEFERALSEGRRPQPMLDALKAQEGPVSRKRSAYRPPANLQPGQTENLQPGQANKPYAELHAHSAFSFLDGASMPEELLEEAARLGLEGIALTDHDGLYGAVRLAETAEAFGMNTVFGAELSLGLTAPQLGVPDPEGTHLLVLARQQDGYHRLAAAITAAQLAGGEKGRPRYDLDELAERADGHWLILTGCRKGTVRRALAAGGPDAAAAELDALTARFGRENVAVELFDHGLPLDSRHNDLLAALAAERGLPTVATGAVHYAKPAQHPIAAALAAVRARRSLDEMDGWLPAAGTAHLRSGTEMAERFARYPGAVERSAQFARELGFPLRRAKPRLPKQEVPPGHTPMSWLRELVWRAVPVKYPDLTDADRNRIERELEVIEQKDFPGYFLIVHDIVTFAKSRGILCQGRGSAANSAICYLLGITAVDSIFYKLPFERFLSALREEEPDIDVDFDSDRREEVIQYVFDKYGRHNAAQVANVISYRPKNAVRDMAKALGYSPGQQDAWSRQVERHGPLELGAEAVSGRRDAARRRENLDTNEIPDEVTALARQVLKFPRHLGIHSGGMVLTDRPVGEVVPIEHARMDKRTVLQWDKDDCAWMGLVKFDLLGLGMLAALQYAFDLIRESLGEQWSLETIPKEEAAVYDMLCRADSIGVFQVESRAQMGLLPRLQPRRFYDLVVQIALVRPGPIQGGAVHPFVRRKLGKEPVTYLHPKLKEPLERTLGVPVFQEQLMQIAMAVGGCSGDDADLLRRAMGSKRGLERIDSLREKLYAGMRENGITGEVADEIYGRIQAFANFGFAESHSLSFALLVYASSWIKLHYPAAFLAALLRAQPMGFYSPATLTADAERHGVKVRHPCIQRSAAQAGLESAVGRVTAEPCIAVGRVPGEAGCIETNRSDLDTHASGVLLESAVGRVAAKPCIETNRSDRDTHASGVLLESAVGRVPGEAGCIETNRSDLDTHASGVLLDPRVEMTVEPTGTDSCLKPHHPPAPGFDRNAPDDATAHRRDGNLAVRLGLAAINGIGEKTAEWIVAERESNGPYRDMADLTRRADLTTAQLEALATAGAFDVFGLTRREALWSAGNVAQNRSQYLRDSFVALQPPLFALQTDAERLADDLWATGISPGDHPIRHVRDLLDERGALTMAALRTAEPGRRIEVGGVVTHRQRPATASGITFVNLEDETGIVNVICTVGFWKRHRRVVRDSPALIVRGILERSDEGVTNLLADHVEPLAISVRHRSRDFR